MLSRWRKEFFDVVGVDVIGVRVIVVEGIGVGKLGPGICVLIQSSGGLKQVGCLSLRTSVIAGEEFSKVLWQRIGLEIAAESIVRALQTTLWLENL